MKGLLAAGSTAAIPLTLAVLALWDLRAELQLLLDHFTWTSLSMIPVHHPLAVGVLLLTPALLRR
ncbi:MAG: hypothetical protein RLZZ32_2076 [Cyanobacteriota bacterium]|jgi:hypothetical protein|uniref:hypothetical protein n=1 Tax=Vulcanococcus sp. TaxID=2856995 RepID=UPI00322B0BD2